MVASTRVEARGLGGQFVDICRSTIIQGGARKKNEFRFAFPAEANRENGARRLRDLVCDMSAN